MRRLRASIVRAMLAAGLTAMSATVGLPQANKPKMQPPPAPPSAAADAPPPPYEAQLDRLAEILGTLAFMRNLCGDADGATWHDKMATLLDAEAATDARKARLAGSYNRGYQGYSLIYRSCTPSARTIIARSLEEGSTLTHELSVRFGVE